MNTVIFTGRIVRDLELRKSMNGVSVCSFNLAINRAFKTNDGVTADFIPIVVWDKQADNLAKYCHKGSLIGVEGRMQSRSYEDRDGKKVFVVECVANRIEFLETKNAANSNENSNYNSNVNSNYKQSSSALDIIEDLHQNNAELEDGGLNINSDELPF